MQVWLCGCLWRRERDVQEGNSWIENTFSAESSCSLIFSLKGSWSDKFMGINCSHISVLLFRHMFIKSVVPAFRLCTNSFLFLFLQNLQLMKLQLLTQLQERNYLMQNWNQSGTQILPTNYLQLPQQILRAYLIIVQTVARLILGNQT